MYLLQVFLVMWVEKSDDVLKHWYLGSVLEITALKEKNYLFLYNTHCKKIHFFYIHYHFLLHVFNYNIGQCGSNLEMFKIIFISDILPNQFFIELYEKLTKIFEA